MRACSLKISTSLNPSSVEHFKHQRQPLQEGEGMSGAFAFKATVWSNYEGLFGHDLGSSKHGIQVETQLQREKGGWYASSLENALDYLEQTNELPSLEQLLHALQICKSKKGLTYAKCVHAHMCRHGVETHGELGSHLVQLFADSGSTFDAQRAFNRLASRNEYCWTALILGYAEYGDSWLSLDTYEKMKQENIRPSRFTFLALLKACTKLRCAEKGLEIHGEISDQGFEDNLIIRNSLMDMYAKCGWLTEAQEAFNQAPCRDVISWNILLAGYANHELNEELLKYACLMQDDGIYPNALTYVSILKACRSLRALDKGLELHAEIIKDSYEDDAFVSCSLVDMYAKCGLLVEAQDVFDEILIRDVVMWTTLIAGYIEHGHNVEALRCLDKMHQDNISPNSSTYLCCLKACCNIRDQHKGCEIHSSVIKTGFNGEMFLGNTLVDMYAKCGLLKDAKKVFDTLLARDVISWSALLTGYAEHGLAEEVLDGFQKMQEDNIAPNSSTLVCTLKACGTLVALDKGRIVHLEVAQEGYEEDPFVCGALLDMYAKCGSLEEAQDIFDNLQVKDLVLWTTLIAGYVDHGLGEEALTCLEHMQMDGLSADATTYVCSIKACISVGALNKGQKLHVDAIKQGFENNAFVGNCLVELYASFSTCLDAKVVFDKLPAKDVVSWNSLMAGYAEQDLHEEVLSCFEQMQMDNVVPNAGTFICILKSCASLEAVERGQGIHANIVENQLEQDLFIGNNLVEMYAKVGLLTEAQEVLEELPTRDVFSWNALIGGYVDHGLGEEPLAFVGKMQLEGISASPVTFIFILKACITLGDIDKGRELHNEIISRGLEQDLFLGNCLVDMYGKCGSSAEAEHLLEKLPTRDSVSWAVLIINHAEHGFYQKVLECFDIMQLEGIIPDVSTYICSLKACVSLKDRHRSHNLHAEMLKKGLDNNMIIGNALLDMYIKQGLLADAGVMFKNMPSRNVVSWTSLISGYVEQCWDEEAIRYLDQMHLEEVSPDVVTYVFSLKACGSMCIIHKGREIHCDIVKKGFDGDSFVGNALIDMYAKVSSLADARKVLEELPARNAVSWNALCAGYAEAGFADEALSCFEQMQLEGVCMDVVSWSTLALVYTNQGEDSKAIHVYNLMQEQGLAPDSMIQMNILQACGNAAALEMGKAVHAQLHGAGGPLLDIILLTAFVDMYSKCGSMYDAQQVFDAMPIKDIVAWNALLTGYARQGERELVLSLFNKMRADDIHPDEVAFLTVLTVCCHAGLMVEAQEYFELMMKVYKIVPTIEQFNCMVDLLGRAGHLSEAVVMLDNMPFQPDYVVWSTMLGACQKSGSLELGRQAFNGAMSVDEDQSAAFVLMSNISADSPVTHDRDIDAMRSNAKR